MPAITLGLAEVEERLRRVRRRLNAFTMLHVTFVTGSMMLLAITILALIGIRGSASMFRIAMWGTVAFAAAACIGGGLHASRRWLDVEATAHVVDRRGQLTDRIATLIDLRLRPRVSRLAPLLVAQALALGPQWQPQQIAPRRIPRSVFLLVAALLALGGTPLLAPQPPPEPMPSTHRASVSIAAPAVLGAPPDNAGRTAGTAGGTADVSQPPVSASHMPDTAGTANAGNDAAQRPLDPSATDNLLAALPDKLRQALLNALHAEPMGEPQQLAAREQDAANGEQRPDTDGREARPADKRETQVHGSKKDAPNGAPSQHEGASGNHKPDPSDAQDRHRDLPNPNLDGSSPAAGDGSSPSDLMAPKGAAQAVAGEGPKTFKLTITSFLRAVEQKGNQPRQQSKRPVAGSASADSDAEAAALNDRQLNDDALRKAEIPPEYEDIVRRVYSAKPSE